MDPIRGEVFEGQQDKGAVGQLRMGHSQFRQRQHLRPVTQHINVKGACAPVFGTNTPGLLLK